MASCTSRAWKNCCALISAGSDRLVFGFDLLLLRLQLGLADVDLDAHAVVKVHVDVGDEDEGEEADEVAAPVVQEHLEAREPQERGRDVVAEAVFTGEEVEELALEETPTRLAPAAAVFAGLGEHFFVGDG